MKTLLWLDDIRNPFTYKPWLYEFAADYAYGDGAVYWVKTYKEFTEWITENGLPTKIAFDHDLSDFQAFKTGYPDLMEDVDSPVIEKTGMDCAHWLVGYCMDNDKKLPEWVIQSANPVGKENINGLLSKFKEHAQR
jgi:hypothetical protein